VSEQSEPEASENRLHDMIEAFGGQKLLGATLVIRGQLPANIPVRYEREEEQDRSIGIVSSVITRTVVVAQQIDASPYADEIRASITREIDKQARKAYRAALDPNTIDLEPEDYRVIEDDGEQEYG
jgi:hypothetical protein